MKHTALLLLLPLAACEVSNGPSGGSCTDHGQCGEMQACIQNTCEDVQCLLSSDCPLHSFCDSANDRFTCREGCESVDDCMAGESCNENSHSCEVYGCRSTELDCPVGSTCNVGSGVCSEVADLCSRTCDVYDAPNCGAGSSCEVGDVTDECQRPQDCEQGYSCGMFLTEHTLCWTNNDCTVAGATCYFGQCVISYCHKDYCLPTCQPANPDCPAGFSCEQTSTGNVCWGACQWFIDHGYL
ncbi:MAG: hypothetical protein KKI08_03920 [Armatimonadetes bacterium]|nr:hypothetical protein [Armatimonadota bacterium]